MATPVRARATYEQLRALPDDVTGHLVDGELFSMPRPGTAHMRATMRASNELDTRFGGGGPTSGWVVMTEVEIHFGPDVLVPDIAGWRTSTLPRLPDVPHLKVPPDWVCEVLSPSTAGFDRVRKSRVYARNGVGWYWLIDPAARTVEVFRLVDGHYLQHSTCAFGERLTLEPFSTESLDPVGWWLDQEA